MTTPIYKKVGRRYVEIGAYENEYLHYPHGAHLIWSRPGGVLTRYQIEPADAALLAAAQRMHDAMMDAMQKADRWEPDEELKGKRAKAWEAYKSIAGEESTLRIKGASMQDVVQAGIDVLMEAAKNNTRQQ
jgi:hypothetical protein